MASGERAFGVLGFGVRRLAFGEWANGRRDCPYGTPFSRHIDRRPDTLPAR
jgi:hypothetical protein